MGGGAKRGSNAFERKKGVETPSQGDFWNFGYVWKRNFLVHKNPCLGVGYVKWHIPIPYSPFDFFPPINEGGHGLFCPLAMRVTEVQPGIVNGGSFFFIRVWKRHFLAHLMPLLRGRLFWSGIYHIPTKINEVGGRWHGRLCPLAIPVTVVQPWFVNGGRKLGSESTERWEGVGGVPSPCRRFFFLPCMKTAFSCTFNAVIRGKVIVKCHTPLPYSPLLIFFNQINGGEGAWALVPLALPVTVVQPSGVPEHFEFWRGKTSKGAHYVWGPRWRSEATERGRVWEGCKDCSEIRV